MSKFLLDTGAVSSAADTMDSLSSKIENILNDLNDLDFDSDDEFDFAGAINTITANINSAAIKIDNTKILLNTVVETHQSLQDSLKLNDSISSTATKTASSPNGGTSTPSSSDSSASNGGGFTGGGTTSGSISASNSGSSSMTETQQAEETSETKTTKKVEPADELEGLYADASETGGTTTDGFTNYYQYDYDDSYGYGTTIATSGCGPTSMAMVLTYLKDEEITPPETASWSLNNGYRIKDKGTAWSYFDAIANEYEIDCEQSAVSKDGIIESLQAGEPVIMSMKNGTFTKSGGHFIVLRGITEDGKIIVSDPGSETKSNETYDIDVFLNEGKQMWSFSN